ncbi:MAG: alpha/beta hydrolase [Deltaproteobacteria bacterium]|nr:alpha/beta hydrolase [Deltaproteobacteria bacterium]
MTSFAPSRGFVQPYEQVFAKLRRGEAQAADGTRLHYEVVGDGPETLLLANGLGGRLYSWLGLIDDLSKRYRCISWDYRGLFESATPANPGALGVPSHAADAAAILDAEGIASAHAVGWSMGVQVSLELAARRPERVRSLVLINGTYGQVFSTAWQPLLRLPIPHTLWHRGMETFIEHPPAMAVLRAVARTPAEAAFAVRKRVMPWRTSLRTLGLRQYMRDVTLTNTANYLRLFQELDAHSAYHLLPTLQQPTTIIAGRYDPLTPSYQSREMAARIPGAELHVLHGSHFVLMERPERVLGLLRDHLEKIGGDHA